MARRGLRTIRRARLAGAAGALALAAALYATRWREVGVRTEGGWLLSIGSGCVQAGKNSARFRYALQGREPGPYLMSSWHTDRTFAWRPFHARTAGECMVVVPLWHGAAGLGGVSVWATGYLAGVRRARADCCLCCGYDLSLVPIAAEGRRCPECGTVPMETA